ncbi:hypothetical protein FVR03_01330 [Pontibacter qinzhouensis]|uniref:Uncharacterized protein n=1 Tax=Pontibacter qinzhouensis TaxID=2603253 RepID=A0A5C8KE79_9BACT|nr:DUF6706 family protein [Pontibacter qinzhouensis]TXK52386.1 hypothetical protein FVR03_01330 [Pontibacter qinzhouensis]
MTNLEAVQSVVGANYPLRETAYTKALIDAGLSPEGEYTIANRKSVDLCAAALILTLITSADIREGGYQVSISEKSVLLSIRSAILASHGVPDHTKPTINANPTYMW